MAEQTVHGDMERAKKKPKLTTYQVSGTPSGRWDDSRWKLSASCTDNGELHIQYKKLGVHNGAILKNIMIQGLSELISDLRTIEDYEHCCTLSLTTKDESLKEGLLAVLRTNNNGSLTLRLDREDVPAFWTEVELVEVK